MRKTKPLTIKELASRADAEGMSMHPRLVPKEEGLPPTLKQQDLTLQHQVKVNKELVAEIETLRSQVATYQQREREFERLQATLKGKVEAFEAILFAYKEAHKAPDLMSWYGRGHRGY